MAFAEGVRWLERPAKAKQLYGSANALELGMIDKVVSGRDAFKQQDQVGGQTGLFALCAQWCIGVAPRNALRLVIGCGSVTVEIEDVEGG